MTKKDELIAKMEEYITFLGEELGNNAVYLHVHHMDPSKEDIAKGSKLRKEIANLKWDVEKEEKRKYDANTCCVCHINYVDSANGYDTCESCSRGI